MEVIKEEKIIKENENSWYRPAIIFFVKSTSWILVPVLIAVLTSKYLINSTKSQTLFFLLIMIAFGITCFGIYREIKIYKKNIEKK